MASTATEIAAFAINFWMLLRLCWKKLHSPDRPAGNRGLRGFSSPVLCLSSFILSKKGNECQAHGNADLSLDYIT